MVEVKDDTLTIYSDGCREEYVLNGKMLKKDSIKGVQVVFASCGSWAKIELYIRNPERIYLENAIDAAIKEKEKRNET